jgi:acetolactate synthase-1/2/3 large subunit
MRLADLLVETLIRDYGVSTAFTVTGGGAMYLNDAFGLRTTELRYIPFHHEQSASMAAEAYAGITGKLAVCQITTGPGGTNAISGCTGAWIDSKPVIFISGQVESFSLADLGTRQTGVQEVKITELVKSITKAAVILRDAYMVLYELDRLISIALSGRKGPVWFDIPLDLQNFEILENNKLPRYVVPKRNARVDALLDVKLQKLSALISNSSKPLLCVGNGARGVSNKILKWAESKHFPIVLGWNAKDFYSGSHPLVCGSIGQFGNRAANILTSKADLILGLGFRFSVPQIGYDPSLFAPQATIVSIDVDPFELQKYSGFIDMGIQADIEQMIDSLLATETSDLRGQIKSWAKACYDLSRLNFDPVPRNTDKIDSFDFTDRLSELLPSESVVVTDMGTSFTCTHQQLQVKAGNRLFTSSGLAAMGFGLPGAIGACFAKTTNEVVTLITGDGGLMFNLQEFQTVKTHKLPLKVIVYENSGYLTMRLMQKSRFGRFVGEGPTSDVDCVDYMKLSNAFGIDAMSISRHDEIENGLSWLYADCQKASVLVVHLDPNQPLTPRVQTMSDKDGRLIPGRLEAMYPATSEDQDENIARLFPGAIT